MLEAITQKYHSTKNKLKKERAMRELARAIDGSPIESSATNIPYKTLALFLAPVAAITASCTASTQEVKQPEVKGQASQWGVPAPRPDGRFGDTLLPDGRQRLSPHRGIDWITNLGRPVITSANGIVIESYYDSDGGNAIVIKHLNGLITGYFHLNDKYKNVNDIIFRGMEIGKVGSTGRLSSNINHLHFQLMRDRYSNESAIDPYNGYWTNGNGKKPYTYDGVTDWDGQARKTGNFLFSAPFAGPVPKGAVNLEQIIRTTDTSDDRIKEFLKNPEQYKQQLFESSMALLAKKNKKVAEELAGLPILNDSISKDEALVVWKLYDAVKDAVFLPNFGLGANSVSKDRINRHIYVLWGAGNKDSYDAMLVFLGKQLNRVRVDVSSYKTEADDTFYKPMHYDGGLRSNVKGNDKDGFSIKFIGRPGSTFVVQLNDQLYRVNVSQLKYGTPLFLDKNLEVGLLEAPNESLSVYAVPALEDMIIASRLHREKVGNKVYQWNFWLQELLWQGMEKDLAGLMKTYGTADNTKSRLDDFIKQIWNIKD